MAQILHAKMKVTIQIFWVIIRYDVVIHKFFCLKLIKYDMMKRLLGAAATIHVDI